MFDDQPVASIGAIAVNQANPDIVWVGTGEGNPRNSVSIGNGVYRSLDGGRTWAHLGLEKTEHIHRIVLHPTDPNVAWVAALGAGLGGEPGARRVQDDRRRQDLAAGALRRSAHRHRRPGDRSEQSRTSCSPRCGSTGAGRGGSSRAARAPASTSATTAARAGSATPRRTACPRGTSAGSASPSRARTRTSSTPWSRPRRARCCARATAAAPGRRPTPTSGRPSGRSTTPTSASIPQWPNRLYNLTARLMVSEDSGASFNMLGRSREVHGDYHAMWIDPHDPDHMVTGSDGGMAISHDRGETWQFVSTLPIGQFYHVDVDMDRPYHVYGGLQDNGSWRGPSSDWTQGGSRTRPGTVIGGGDGFDTHPDPADSMAGYSESQGGELVRWNLRSREPKLIKPAQPAGLERLRFNWNAALAQDPFDPGTIYIGSQYVHKSTDRGASWTVISPDLTTDNPDWQQQQKSGGLTLDVSAAENFTTLLAIAPEPVAAGGDLDGIGRRPAARHPRRRQELDEPREERPRGAGQHLDPRHPAVEVRRRLRPSWSSTTTGGRTSPPTSSAPTTGGRPGRASPPGSIRGYALAVEQDPADRNLLFLGTEFGLYVSFDGGGHWIALEARPADHLGDGAQDPSARPRPGDRHPRARPLRARRHHAAARGVAGGDGRAGPLLSQPAGAPLPRRAGAAASAAAAPASSRGENRAYGALLTFSLNAPGLPLPDDEKERQRKEAERDRARAAASAAEVRRRPAGDRPADRLAAGGRPRPRGDGGGRGRAGREEAGGWPGGGGAGAERGPKAEIRITDASGKLVRTLKPAVQQGLNRVVWDFGREAYRNPEGQQRGRPRRRQRPQRGPRHLRRGRQVRRPRGQGDGDGRGRSGAQELAGRLAGVGRGDGPRRRACRTRWRTPSTASAPPARTSTWRSPSSTPGTRRRSATPPRATPPRKPDPSEKALRQSARDLQKKLSAVERRLYVSPDIKGLRRGRHHGAQPRSRTSAARSATPGRRRAPPRRPTSRRPTPPTRAALADFNKLYAEDVPAFRKQLADARIDLLGDRGRSR